MHCVAGSPPDTVFIPGGLLDPICFDDWDAFVISVSHAVSLVDRHEKRLYDVVGIIEPECNPLDFSNVERFSDFNGECVRLC